MRPAQFTDQDIIGAGKEIRDTGRLVTPFGIRNILGGGNTTRIREVWDRFLENERDEPELQEQAPEPATLPPQLHEHALQAKKTLTGFIDGLYMQAYTLVETDLSQRYKRDFEALKEKQTQTDSSLAEAEKSIAKADRDLEELSDERDSAKAELESVRAENARLTAQLASVQKDLAEAEEELEERASEVAVFSKTAADAQRSQAAAEAAGAEKDKAIARLEADLEAARKGAAESGKEAEAARTALALRDADLKRVQGELATAEASLENERRAADELRGVVDKQSADLHALERRIQEVTSEQLTISEMRDLLLDQIRHRAVAEVGQQGDSGDDQASQG